MLDDDFFNLAQFMIPKAAVARQRHGLQPKLSIPSRMADMDVCWLAILQAVKEEPIATNSE
jgi:hypothetical protein